MKSLTLVVALLASAAAQEVDDLPEDMIPDESTPIVVPAKKDGNEEELLSYRGEWAFEVPEVWPGLSGDTGLVVKTAAAHHAISSKFDTPVDPTGKSLVVQYEVKFQKKHDCGGAYIKLLTSDADYDPAKYTDQTPYTIMFGPDKCGSSNKVHFIFRHQNPISKEWEEKHLKTPPAGKIEKLTSLYTLIVQPDNTFEIKINNESVKTGSLLEDFSPAVEPSKEIEDETDIKPEDWVDEAKIPDPDATKPDDWDESAPVEIVDTEATMPDDWYVDEPEFIPDPEASKPEDWEDEEDGEWVAPTVENPKCLEASGCGPWEQPMKPNPDYKGKWAVPMIDNPAYIGAWSRKMIANPNYFLDEHPSNFNKIGAIGIELWTMSDGITFDNIYVGHNVDDAAKLATEQWKVKHDTELLYQAEKEKETEKSDEKFPDADGLTGKANKIYKDAVAELKVIRQKWHSQGPMETIKEFKWIFISAFVSIWLLVSSVLRLLRTGTSMAEADAKKKKSDGKQEKAVEPTAVKKSSPSAKKRATRKKEEEEVEDSE